MFFRRPGRFMASVAFGTRFASPLSSDDLQCLPQRCPLTTSSGVYNIEHSNALGRLVFANPRIRPPNPVWPFKFFFGNKDLVAQRVLPVRVATPELQLRGHTRTGYRVEFYFLTNSVVFRYVTWKWVVHGQVPSLEIVCKRPRETPGNTCPPRRARQNGPIILVSASNQSALSS